MITGLDLHTHHPDGALCNDTTGVYVHHGRWAGGALKNSECNTGAWGAWAPESNTLTLGPVRYKVGALLGVITGYRSASVIPMASVSVAANIGGNWWARASYLPKPPGGASSGIHFSIELEH